MLKASNLLTGPALPVWLSSDGIETYGPRRGFAGQVIFTSAQPLSPGQPNPRAGGLRLPGRRQHTPRYFASDFTRSFRGGSGNAA
jgi:hypothetical protein